MVLQTEYKKLTHASSKTQYPYDPFPLQSASLYPKIL